jgi:hypothetical protein
MQNDSLETLLLRHYGSTAPTPAGLEQRLHASVRQEAGAMQRQQYYVATRRVNRRSAVRLVALGSAGLGLLGIGMEGIQMLESALAGQDITQTAFP